MVEDIVYIYTILVVHDFHLASSTPTEEVGAAKPQETPGKQFLSLYSIMCLQIFENLVTILFYLNII